MLLSQVLSQTCSELILPFFFPVLSFPIYFFFPILHCSKPKDGQIWNAASQDSQASKASLISGDRGSFVWLLESGCGCFCTGRELWSFSSLQPLNAPSGCRRDFLECFPQGCRQSKTAVSVMVCRETSFCVNECKEKGLCIWVYWVRKAFSKSLVLWFASSE